jgi:DNA-binding transcriptional LysR family regulator
MQATNSRAPVLGQLSDMDLRLLRVFRAVVDCGGMAAAELELNIGISTVSRHVKDLETRLGLVLCRRGRGGFGLTAEGRQVYDEALRLFAAVDVFRGGMAQLHQRLAGPLAIALFEKTASNPASRIPQALARFVQQAPAVELQVHIAGIHEIERGVLDGSWSLGVVPQHRASQSLVYDDLFGERMQLYCGPGHPLFARTPTALDWADLRGLPFAGLGYHSPNLAFAHEARLSRTATGDDQEAVALLVLSGSYLGFLPDHYAAPFVRQGQLKALAPRRLHYDCRFVAIHRPKPELGRSAALLRDCLLQAHAAA